ncbi:MAG: indolepyruvate oxidoreductase subunit beta [Anaerolineae bacterium]|nr:indolepyruvate oxidoreductase subunit beta [Anaerolineae bacterium]
MKYDIVLAGVGGQGVLSIAAILGVAAVEDGLHIKQAEVHGMSQRGGAVQSHFRIADRTIHSDLISHGGADMVLSMEPMETLRYVPFLAPEGVIIAEMTPFINIPDYPDLDTIHQQLREYPHAHLIDGQGIAKQMRAIRASNMVLLGAASVFVPLEAVALETAIHTIFGRKGEKVVATNIEAFRKGRALVAETV